MELKTVKIVSPVTDENPLGYIVINETDLSEDHEVFGEEGAKKADKALSVADLKAALAEKGVEIPEGAKKADLQALLDEANKA
ncbi:HeH/LEM domain-containing protein [Ralstonia nicotianae]